MIDRARELTATAKELLNSSDDERVGSLSREPFVSYGTAKRILIRMNALLHSPRSHRPASMLIAGATNNGKTMLVRRFTDANLPVHDEDADAVICPVIYIQMPPTPDARQFYLAILEKLHVPIQRTAVLSHVQAQTLKICKIVGLKVLIIDELHNIHGGRIEQQRYFLNLLRYISNELEIHIIGCGLASALRALQSDEQLTNRFEHWPLPIWKNDKACKVLLNTIESTLPLRRQSSLSETEMIERIVGLSGGTIGEIVRLIREAAETAIRSGAERIDTNLLDGLGWVAPENRRRAAEAVLGHRG